MERYLDSDLEDVYYGRKTFEDVAKKYGTKVSAVKKAFWYRGWVINRRIIIIHNNLTHRQRYVYSVSECARELNVSRQTIYSALNGQRVKLLETMSVELEVIQGGKKERDDSGDQ